MKLCKYDKKAIQEIINLKKVFTKYPKCDIIVIASKEDIEKKLKNFEKNY